MIADGTLSNGSASIAASAVTNRGASLPSSSTSTAERTIDEPSTEAEGRAPVIDQPETQAGDAVILTGAVRSDGSPSSALEPQSEDEDAGAGVSGPNGLGEQLDRAKEQEQERLSRLSEEISENINDRLELRFETDEETGIELFQLIEKETGEVVRQFPPEEMLDFLEKFRDFSGFLLSEQA